jgi:phosphatidylinositol 3-kinase
LGNNFHWYLMVECEDRTSSSHKTFAKVAFQFMKSLSETADGVERRGVFKRQAELVGKLQSISREIRAMRGDRSRKIDRLKASVHEYDLESMDALPLFLDAGVQMVGIDPGNRLPSTNRLPPTPNSPVFCGSVLIGYLRRRIGIQIEFIPTTPKL